MWSATSCWARCTLMMHFSVDLMAHFINESQRMYCTESYFVFAVVKCLFIRHLHGPFIHCFQESQAQIDLKSNIPYYIVWSNYFIHNNWIALNLKLNEPFHQFRGSKFSAHEKQKSFLQNGIALKSGALAWFHVIGAENSIVVRKPINPSRTDVISPKNIDEMRLNGVCGARVAIIGSILLFRANVFPLSTAKLSLSLLSIGTFHWQS